MAYNSDSNAALKQDSSDSAEIMQIAKQLHPISDLNEINLRSLCKSASVMHLQRNDQLKLDTVFRGLVYVVEGSVTLYNGKNEISTINAGSSFFNAKLAR